MNYWFEGVKVGLVLSLLAGPIFLALVQTGIEKGLRAGATVGLGVWISDVMFITGVHYGLSYVSHLVSGQAFKLTLGIAGGLLLVVFGTVALFSKPMQTIPQSSMPPGTTSWLGLWLKGFLINTVNPFTFFFWIGIAGHVVVDGGFSPEQSFNYFAGIMSVIVATDFMKVALAKRIRRFLNPQHLLWMRRVAGFGLILFGAAMMVRAMI